MNHGKISNATDDSRHRPGSSEFFKGWIRTWKRAVRKIPDITNKQMLEHLDDVWATDGYAFIQSITSERPYFR